MPWQFEGASCWGLDTEMFFPDKGGSTKQIKKICKSCYWTNECLTYSLHYRVQGIWAGTSPDDRDILRKKLNIIAKPVTNERFVA